MSPPAVRGRCGVAARLPDRDEYEAGRARVRSGAAEDAAGGSPTAQRLPGPLSAAPDAGQGGGAGRAKTNTLHYMNVVQKPFANIFIVSLFFFNF